VLDPAVMPAVDAPDPGGIAYAELELLLAGLVATPRCLGVEVTVFDPDYDPDGAYAAELVDMLVAGLAPVRAGAADPGPGRRPRVPAARTRSPFVDFAPEPLAPRDAEPVARPREPVARPREPVARPREPEPVREPVARPREPQPAPTKQSVPKQPVPRVDFGPGKLRRRPPEPAAEQPARPASTSAPPGPDAPPANT
jgi:arginase